MGLDHADLHASTSRPPNGQADVSIRQQRRLEIVKAARELYEEQGLSATAISDIARRAGLSRTLMYHYFPGKDAITSAVLDDYIDDCIEALKHWDNNRVQGQVEEALTNAVKVLRIVIFDNDPFYQDIHSTENAELYTEFIGRVAQRCADRLTNTTVRDYAQFHQVQIKHVPETFYILLVGLGNYLRRHPDADDELIKDLIAQTLHMER